LTTLHFRKGTTTSRLPGFVLALEPEENGIAPFDRKPQARPVFFLGRSRMTESLKLFADQAVLNFVCFQAFC
jgi:hypothetical protein